MSNHIKDFEKTYPILAKKFKRNNMIYFLGR